MQIFPGKTTWRILVCLAISLVFVIGPVTITRAKEGEKYPTWKMWGEKYWPTKPVRGGYMKRAAVRHVGMMNPNHWPVNDWVVLATIYEKLVARDGTYQANIPWLAKSWEFLDPVTVVMKLREGVTFHDGSKFSAETVKYQLDWIRDKKNGAWPRAYLRNLKSTEVLDKHTIKWTFKNPWGAFLGSLPAGIPGWQLSAKALAGDSALRDLKSIEKKAARARKKADALKKKAETGTEKDKKTAARAEVKAVKLGKKAAAAAKAAEGAKNMDTNPVGTASFMFEESRPGNYVKLKRNPNWWFAKYSGHPDMPYLDGIITIIIPDPAVQLANLRSGKIDVMGVDKSSYALIKNDPNLYVHLTPGNHLAGLAFNHARGPCQDIRVRKAVSHAIDRKALIAGTQFGLGRIASCGFPDDHWAHNPNLKPVSYDPELSKRLLAEAGYPKGLTLNGFMGNTPMSISITEA
ncbi:MAG: ABC transporter substrate-binding protein, partial [Deltaproteobacteria bacterium]|nr:ABC transporter substrate-binding protein [Deltaproteobacteria bacterium]